MNQNQKIALLEGLLFICGDDGINIDNIAFVLEINKKESKKLIKLLNEEYIINQKRGLMIKSFSSKYRLTTKKEYYNFYLKLTDIKKESRLSQASLETLAIIAYRGPISKPKIEELRGVNSDNVIYKLKDRELIEKAGKSELPGKPVNYQITEKFLKVFNLNSVQDLPELQNLKIEDDQNLFE